jgi:hypothetical protein
VNGVGLVTSTQQLEITHTLKKKKKELFQQDFLQGSILAFSPMQAATI